MLTRNANRLPMGLLVLGLVSACFEAVPDGSRDSGLAPDAACSPESAAALCGRLGTNCGDVLGQDSCGAARTVLCGTCAASQACGGAAKPNVCGNGTCQKWSCAAEGKNCGSISNGCDGVLQCGTCAAPRSCGGGGVANVCGTGTALDAGQAADSGGYASAVFEYVGATPAEVLVGGNATVTFRARNTMDQPLPQLPVVFTLSQNPGGAALDPTSSTTVADGTVSTVLTAGYIPGTVKVQIANISDSVTKVSDPITVSGGGINAKNFTMSCTHASIGGFEADGLQMTCTVSGSDLNGAFVPNSKVTLKTEAGGVPASADFAADSTTGGGIASFTYRTQCKWPKDVPPLGGATDPGHSCAFINRCGLGGTVTEQRTCNPRDGLATLIAITTGSEAFDDTNGNGKWDPGENKTDLGEPFVDANDNNTRDADEDFYDTNNNGVWDGPNGVWDASTAIWTSYKILWTGGLDWTSATPQSSIKPDTGVTEQHCVPTQYVLKIFDVNGNPPTASGAQDGVTVNAQGNVLVQHVSGYFDGVTPPVAGEKQGLVLVDVQDAHPCACTPNCPPPEPYTLDFSLNRTLDGTGAAESHPELGTHSGTYQ